MTPPPHSQRYYVRCQLSIVSNFFMFSRIVFKKSNKMYCLQKKIYIVEINSL